MRTQLQYRRAQELGTYFKKLRENANLNLPKAAKEIGIRSYRFIHNWESGFSVPPMKRIKKVAKVYGTTDLEIRKRIYNFELAELKTKWGFQKKRMPKQDVLR